MRGGYEICQVCFWEDDGQDEANATEPSSAHGGPNRDLSLAQARENFRTMGASSERRIPLVRDPEPHEHH